MAVIALGNNAIHEGNFYASLHQKEEEDLGVQCDHVHDNADILNLLNAIAATDDHITSSGKNDMNSEDIDQTLTNNTVQEDILQQFNEFSEDITETIKNSPIVVESMKTFLRRYKVLTKPGGFINARLLSAFHHFGWVFGGTVSRKDHNGRFCRGRRTPSL